MTTRRYYANAAPQRTLASPISASDTSCTVSGLFTGWQTQFPFYACLDVGTASAEIVSVTGIASSVATITRGGDGSVAITHTAGATLDAVFVRQDLDEANAHTVATAGVHGVSGSVVGTTDVQTLSNKTLAAPAITGTVSGALTASGAVSATAAGTGLAVTNNATVGGTAAVTGAVTAASVTANANGAVKGVVIPKSYADEAAATAALGTPVTGSLVWLTAPTGVGNTGAGWYYWVLPLWNAISLTQNGIYNGETQGVATVGLTSASTDFAMTDTKVAFTITSQRRVRVVARYRANSASAPDNFLATPAVVAGSTATLTGAVLGRQTQVSISTTGGPGQSEVISESTFLLAAGTYSAFVAAQCTTDITGSALAGYCAAYDVGPS